MLGLNVFSLMVFTAVNLFACAICKFSEWSRTRVLRVLCIILLSLSLLRYMPLSFILAGKVTLPVEFSAVTSFTVPVVFLTGSRKMKSWAAYSGMMAGFFYFMAMIFGGGMIYAEYPPYEIYSSMFCHGTMYLCGLVALRTQKFNPSDLFKLLAGVGFVLLNALLFRSIADNGTRLFIYEIMDGRYIRQVFPEAAWGHLLPIYYIVMTGLVMLTAKLFFKLNKLQYEKYLNSKSIPVQPAAQAY